MAPNILVTGTPGTGKTTVCGMLAAATSLRHVEIGTLVKQEQLHCGWDEEFDCYIIDEDKVRWGTMTRTLAPSSNNHRSSTSWRTG